MLDFVFCFHRECSHPARIGIYIGPVAYFSSFELVSS